MKISLDWLNDYLQQPCDADTVERTLTNVGFPVEARESVACSVGGPATMLSLEITSNRGDCLSHLGVARELAAASQGTVQPPTIQRPGDAGRPVDTLAQVDNQQPDLCPLYTARAIIGVRVGPSPDWLVRYLETVGLRSVNNVVDVTNFVLWEMGQPLHAFDLDKLAGRRIHVRRAKKSEPFDALDASSHKLGERMLVIADDQQPVAVAGVMGGRGAEVTGETKNLLLESAIFAPLSVRNTSRALKLASDSSYRFERGVDPLGVDRASRRAAGLILQLAGGTLAAGMLRAGRDDPEPRRVSMRVDRCNALLGTRLAARQQAAFLTRLGLDPTLSDAAIECTIPTYRLDLHREVDLIEEVARLYGLDNVALQHKIHIVTRPPQPAVAAERLVRDVLAAHGDHETVTFTFLAPQLGEPFVPEQRRPVVIADQRRKAEPMLRPSLLPSLLSCRKTNQDRGNADVRLFETAATWTSRNGHIVEQQRLAIVRDAQTPDAALRDLRGALEELIERLGAADALAQLTIQPIQADNFTVAASIALGTQQIGRFGLISPAIQTLFALQTPVVAAELDLPPLLELYPPRRTVAQLPRFPGIERDLSIVVAEAVHWRRIEQAVRQAAPAMLETLSFLGAYRGKPIPRGHKSVSLRLRFRDPQATLRHEQVDPQVDAVLKALAGAVGATLRE